MADAVLAIRSRALGDLVVLTPALRALRRGHPGASLELVTESRYAPLFEGAPEVDRVWRLGRTHLATARLALALRRRRYPVAVDFFGNPRSAFLTAASGAARRVGFALRGRGSAYHVRVERQIVLAPGRREYAADIHLRLARAAGGEPDDLGPHLHLGEPARAAGARLLDRAGVPEPERTIGLVAAGSWATKTWPLSHAALLARDLLASGSPVLLITGPGEARVTEGMRRLVPGLSLLPPGDVAALAGAVGRLRAVIGTESGARHLAVALGIPTFTWFGPTHPDSWTPPDPRHGYWQTSLPCRACDRTSCPHWNCLPGLAPQTAATQVLAHLERHGRSTATVDPAARG
ncbi:MAG TPA: glycosyltransferase family 9 protein [Candidatus Limnocylindria bacterium]|nr:glycosyltransferase family 9 protein [Candidatus Limnocylindria bacterium]